VGKGRKKDNQESECCEYLGGVCKIEEKEKRNE
jgi:hypothetical protein